jgi:hypothetical protein
LAKEMWRTTKGSKRVTCSDDDRLPDFAAVSAHFPVPQIASSQEKVVVSSESPSGSLAAKEIAQIPIGTLLQPQSPEIDAGVNPLVSASLLALQALASPSSAEIYRPTEPLNPFRNAHSDDAFAHNAKHIPSQLNSILLLSILQHLWQPSQTPTMPFPFPACREQTKAAALDMTELVLGLLTHTDQQRESGPKLLHLQVDSSPIPLLSSLVRLTGSPHGLPMFSL